MLKHHFGKASNSVFGVKALLVLPRAFGELCVAYFPTSKDNIMDVLYSNDELHWCPSRVSTL